MGVDLIGVAGFGRPSSADISPAAIAQSGGPES